MAARFRIAPTVNGRQDDAARKQNDLEIVRLLQEAGARQ
jgi:hypothetical protein